jgi:hypothetical protein
MRLSSERLQQLVLPQVFQLLLALQLVELYSSTKFLDQARIGHLVSPGKFSSVRA